MHSYIDLPSSLYFYFRHRLFLWHISFLLIFFWSHTNRTFYSVKFFLFSMCLWVVCSAHFISTDVFFSFFSLRQQIRNAFTFPFYTVFIFHFSSSPLLLSFISLLAHRSNVDWTKKNIFKCLGFQLYSSMYLRYVQFKTLKFPHSKCFAPLFEANTQKRQFGSQHFCAQHEQSLVPKKKASEEASKENVSYIYFEQSMHVNNYSKNDCHFVALSTLISVEQWIIVVTGTRR